ncbi:MAG: hypothetical protein Q9227_000736 [Pyrenula ochraceoflavens]
MAVIDLFKACVKVNGEALEEYDVDSAGRSEIPRSDQGCPNISKYIEAKSEKNFKLGFTILPGYDFDSEALQWAVEIDGDYADGCCVGNEGYDALKGFKDELEGIRAQGDDHKWVLHRFQFSELVCQDDNDQAQDPDLRTRIENLGSIVVTVTRRKKVELDDGDQQETMEWNAITEGVTEKALKGSATSHRTRLDPEVGIEDVASSYSEQDGAPLATFTFLYRSQRALQDLMDPPERIKSEEVDDRDLKRRGSSILDSDRKYKAQSPSSSSLQSFTPGSHRRSHPNLQHLSLAPLTPKYPIEPSDFDAYVDPATSTLHTSSSLSRMTSIPSSDGMLATTSMPVLSRSQNSSQVRLNGQLKRRKQAGGLSLSGSPKTMSGTTTPSGALTSASYGGAMSGLGEKSTTLNSSSSTPWLVQTGLALTDSSRESKGQSWIAKRESSTGLHSPAISSPLRTPNEDFQPSNYFTGPEGLRTSRTSGRNTPAGGRSRRGSLSRNRGRRDLIMTPAAAAASIVQDSKSRSGSRTTLAEKEGRNRPIATYSDVPGGAHPEWADEATQAEAREERNRQMIEEMDRAELLGEDWDPDMDDEAVFEYKDVADGPGGIVPEDEKQLRRQLKTQGFFVGRWLDEAIDSLLRLEEEDDGDPGGPSSPSDEKKQHMEQPEVAGEKDSASEPASGEVESLEVATLQDTPQEAVSAWEDIRWFGRLLWDTATS